MNTGSSLFAQVITIGDELNSGKTLNTNSFFICRQLTVLGIEVVKQITVGDCLEDIVFELKQINWSGLIILTGGLGSTRDDLTKKALSDYFQDNLVLNEGEQFFLSQKVKKNHFHTQQAKISNFFISELNPYGSVSFLYRKVKESYLFVLPGVPYECEMLLKNKVIPKLKLFFPLFLNKKKTVSIQTISITESLLSEKIEALSISKEVKISFLPEIYTVLIRLSSESLQKLKEATIKIKREIKDFIFSTTEISLEKLTHDFLMESDYRLGIVESCTGGKVSAKLTAYSGASKYLQFCMVLYSNEAKMFFAGVKRQTLVDKGAVSKEVAKDLLVKIVKKHSLDIGVSITGFASGEEDISRKQVGQVYIGIYFEGECKVKSFLFKGDRNQVQEKSALCALNEIRKLFVLK